MVSPHIVLNQYLNTQKNECVFIENKHLNLSIMQGNFNKM